MVRFIRPECWAYLVHDEVRRKRYLARRSERTKAAWDDEREKLWAWRVLYVDDSIRLSILLNLNHDLDVRKIRARSHAE